MMLSTQGAMASYCPEAPLGSGMSVMVLKYTVPSEATSRSSAKMISVPGYLCEEGLTLFASIVVKLLVALTKIRPCETAGSATKRNVCLYCFDLPAMVDADDASH